MSLADVVAKWSALAPYRRLQALRVAADDALAVWRRYRLDGVPLDYRDSIVGLLHTVDDTLPARALAEVDRVLAGEPADPAIAADYLEPITAMQDDDLDLPGPVGLAYYAIYNLHGLVVARAATPPVSLDAPPPVGERGRLVLDQVVGALELDDALLDAWAAEWWTRVWDAWASAAEPAYQASPLSAAAFAALAAGDVAGALAVLDDAPRTSLLRAVVLALGDREPEALVLAARALGVPLTPELHGWLRRHLVELVPEAIAVTGDRTRYAVIHDHTRVVWDRATRTADTASYPGPLRLARFVAAHQAPDTLWVAGDLVDALGVFASFLIDDLDAGDHVAWQLTEGTRAVVAIGPGAVVGRHASRALVFQGDRGELLGELPVEAAAIAGDGSLVVTHDALRVSIWWRDPASCARITHPAGATPRRIALGGAELVIAWSDATSSIHVLDRP